MTDIDVLVVGGGPTGLTMGSELARRGVSCRVVERLETPSLLSKAIGVQARTLEIFDDMGIAEEMVSRGVELEGVTMLADGEPVISIDFGELDTRYPFLLSLPQSDTEALLAALLAKRGVELERGVELVALDQDDRGVSCVLRNGNDESRVRARYVVGADGAHSTVRKQIGLSLEGKSYEEQFLLADVRVPWDLPRHRVTTFFSERGLLASFPIPGDRFRLIATTNSATTPSLGDLSRLIYERSGIEAEPYDPAWTAAFRIHCRQVAEYRRGRVLLCGDAAHIHSPVGGQGLNTGIQDAHNLAWKLALLVRGRAKAAVLDSYQSERHGIAANVLRSTDFATMVATLRHPVARAIRDSMAQMLTSLEVVQQRVRRQVAELDLTYASSPIVSEDASSVLESRLGSADEEETPNLRAWRAFAVGPRAGDRAPDAAGRDREGRTVRLATLLEGSKHTVLLFDGQAATPEGYAHMTEVGRDLLARHPDDVRVVVVVPGERRPALLDWEGPILFDPDGELEERYGAAAECVYIVRPDLYIGFRGQPIEFDPVFAYFAKIFADR